MGSAVVDAPLCHVSPDANRTASQSAPAVARVAVVRTACLAGRHEKARFDAERSPIEWIASIMQQDEEKWSCHSPARYKKPPKF